MSYQPKVALVHDDFTQSGGAESLFATIASIYNKAPIYTSLVDWSKLPQSVNRERIRLSFMQKVPLSRQLNKLLLPFYPLAFESFDLSNFDVVISSTTRFAKSIITKPHTVHICYVNSVPRFLWNEEAQKEYLPQFAKVLTKPIINWLKRWDVVASSRVDGYIANSKNVRDQIKKIYNKESEVVYPFADLDFFTPPQVHNWQLKSQNYYLVVSRLVKWKKIDTAIKACQKLGVNLKIIGAGPDQSRLERIAGSVIPTKVGIQNNSANRWIPNQVRDDKRETVEFLGKTTREELRELYQNAKALIVTQEEDFGISMVEAQACGLPVIAYEKGGQNEIVADGKTGIFYHEQVSKSLADAIIRANEVKWSISACRKNSLKFSKANFVKDLKRIIRKYQYNS